MKFIYKASLLFILSIFLVDCARKGRPEGGPKDETAPIMVIAKPAHESLNFKENTIRIYFDEYIVLKDLTKELVISPPLKNPPLITPLGTPSKYINIKILDTLQPNTTYTFNFGDAVQDNNENNKLSGFKYVFSTGTYLDSLTTKGTVNDALKGKLLKNVSVLLYRLDSTYTDSLIYKQKPNYVANTIDSLHYEFSNIREGKYLVMALEEENRDYIFNPKTDKIGYLTDTISLPNDSIINSSISVFKEVLPYQFKRAKEEVKGKIQFGFEGKQENMAVKVITNVPSNFKSFSQFEKAKDSLNFWHTLVDVDSLNFLVTNKDIIDSVTVKLRKKKIDSLLVTSNVGGTLHLKDTLFITTNNPIENIDDTKFTMVDKDTVTVALKIEKKDINKLAVFFEKQPKKRYDLTILPKAITDIFETANDSLNYKFNTKEVEDYGSITLNIQKETSAPVIVQLLQKETIIESIYVTDSKKIDFTLLEPKEYSIRAIIDSNSNEVWDTGSFLNKTQPERIVYFTDKLALRANWAVNETFVIK